MLFEQQQQQQKLLQLQQQQQRQQQQQQQQKLSFQLLPSQADPKSHAQVQPTHQVLPTQQVQPQMLRQQVQLQLLQPVVSEHFLLYPTTFLPIFDFTFSVQYQTSGGVQPHMQVSSAA